MASEETRPLAVRTAASHVRQYFPEVVQVFFALDGRWFYMDDDAEAPVFGGVVDVALLEAAVGAADDADGLPCAYYIGDL